MGTGILLDGKIVNYEALGRGRPVIFLHSWVGSWRYWFSAMQAISNSFRAYAIDLWGFGDTARDPSRYTINKQTFLLKCFLDEMALGKVAIIGHGLGALVGFNFCNHWPQSVDRLMAISCPLDFDSINPRMRSAPPSELIEWLGSSLKEEKVSLADASKADPHAITISISSFLSNDLFYKMCQTQTGCLLVYGQNDPAISTPSADDFTDLPYMMHYVVLDNAGHFLMLDEPVLFNQVLKDFLLLDSGISPRELRL